MPNLLDNFSQYSNGIADSSYAFDFCQRVTIGATSTATVTFPSGSNIIRIRNITVTDVTAAAGGTQATLLACYFRIDGITASAGAAPDGSNSRILKPGASLDVARHCASENGIKLFNPNAASVIIQIELGA